MKIANVILSLHQRRVKAEVVKTHPRIIRKTLSSHELEGNLKTLGRHIARCRSRQIPVRIPAMKASELGQVLRTLELKRAYS